MTETLREAFSPKSLREVLAAREHRALASTEFRSSRNSSLPVLSPAVHDAFGASFPGCFAAGLVASGRKDT